MQAQGGRFRSDHTCGSGKKTETLNPSQQTPICNHLHISNAVDHTPSTHKPLSCGRQPKHTIAFRNALQARDREPPISQGGEESRRSGMQARGGMAAIVDVRNSAPEVLPQSHMKGSKPNPQGERLKQQNAAPTPALTLPTDAKKQMHPPGDTNPHTFATNQP